MLKERVVRWTGFPNDHDRPDCLPNIDSPILSQIKRISVSLLAYCPAKKLHLSDPTIARLNKSRQVSWSNGWKLWEVLKGQRNVLFLLFFHSAAWEYDVMAGVPAAILYYKDDDHILGMAKWRVWREPGSLMTMELSNQPWTATF